MWAQKRQWQQKLVCAARININMEKVCEGEPITLSACVSPEDCPEIASC